VIHVLGLAARVSRAAENMLILVMRFRVRVRIRIRVRVRVTEGVRILEMRIKISPPIIIR